MKLGVILARMQPIHNGHLELIRQAVNENEKVLLLIGSADKLNKRNPIPISIRLDLVKKAINEEFGEDAKKIDVVPLDDLVDESNNTHEWGFYLYSHIVGITKEPTFTIYYSDGFEIIMKWFPSFIARDFVSFKLNARGATHNNLSATKVRELIINNNMEELEKVVPKCVIEKFAIIKEFIVAMQ